MESSGSLYFYVLRGIGVSSFMALGLGVGEAAFHNFVFACLLLYMTAL